MFLGLRAQGEIGYVFVYNFRFGTTIKNMVQFTIMIAERDGAASVLVTRGHDNPTELEAMALEEECRMGFARHSGAIQRLAEI